MSGSVVITLPKLMSNPNSPVFKDYVECKNELMSKGRKRRLDHLSWEEKIQRKKLKNRVAAQTSRDRKKQKMDDMENTIQELMEHNQKLLDECENLKNLNEKLLAEKQSMQSLCRCAENRISEPPVGLVESNSRPAVSDPQLKGGPTGPAAEFTLLQQRRYKTVALVLRLLLCLTNTTSSKALQTLTTSRTLRSLPIRCLKISPKNSTITKQRFHQIICRKIIQEKWWGRHNQTWKPLSVL